MDIRLPLQLSFNISLKIDFQGSRVTSDGGLIVVRELDERLGLGDLIAQHLTDSRRGKNTQLPLVDLLRQSVYSRMAGYEDVNDAERLAQDPTFRLIGSEKIWDRGAASLRGRLVLWDLHEHCQYRADGVEHGEDPHYACDTQQRQKDTDDRRADPGARPGTEVEDRHGRAFAARRESRHNRREWRIG